MRMLYRVAIATGLALLLAGFTRDARAADRLRVLIETDAGGDPDDEQSLVRFLLYCNEWDVEGIICNRPKARDRENLNPERTGLGIGHRLIKAYGECYPKLVQHDRRYPRPDDLLRRTVAGTNDTDDGVNLIIAAVDRDDPRPLWYAEWGTDKGAATVNLKRALDKVLRERGPKGYAKFKDRLRIVSHDQYGDHTTKHAPPFKLWVNTFEPPRDGKRWYHRFSALTATAGGFDLKRDVMTGHGPLGALYPTNTTHTQKEGDTMTFLYLMPTGMNDPEHPAWGSWAGRYGPNEKHKGKPYYWANQTDAWQGTTSRDNTLKRWAAHLQNDFKARLDWCVKDLDQANHPPVVKVNGELQRTVAPGDTVVLDASNSTDPDGDELKYEWVVHAEPGSYRGPAPTLSNANSSKASFVAPNVKTAQTLHLIVSVTDAGSPALTRYRRVIATLQPADPVRVRIQTDPGDITVELDAAKAPATVANFLKYVDGGFYTGGRFHRTVTPANQPDSKVKIEVIQAGINPDKAKDEFEPVKLERTKDTGLSHTDGTISMARDGPDTATSDFFICLGDQKELDFGGKRNPDGQGFAAFGRVVKGMDVVKKIQQSPADGQTLKPPVKILKVTREK